MIANQLRNWNDRKTYGDKIHPKKFIEHLMKTLKSNGVFTKLALDIKLNQYILVGIKEAESIYDKLNHNSPNKETNPFEISDLYRKCTGSMANYIEAIADAIYLDMNPNHQANNESINLQPINTYVNWLLNYCMTDYIPYKKDEDLNYLLHMEAIN